jgi:hypothetical protein
MRLTKPPTTKARKTATARGISLPSTSLTIMTTYAPYVMKIGCAKLKTFVVLYESVRGRLERMYIHEKTYEHKIAR